MSPPHKPRQRDSLFYTPYYSEKKVLEGIARGYLFEGEFRSNPHTGMTHYVTIPGFPQDLIIERGSDRNRALHGDVVVVELSNQNYWPKNAAPLESDVTIQIGSRSLRIPFNKRPTGKVVYISKMRNKGQIPITSGTIHPPNRNQKLFSQEDHFIFFRPLSKLVPQGIVFRRNWHPFITDVINRIRSPEEILRLRKPKSTNDDAVQVVDPSSSLGSFSFENDFEQAFPSVNLKNSPQTTVDPDETNENSNIENDPTAQIIQTSESTLESFFGISDLEENLDPVFLAKLDFYTPKEATTLLQSRFFTGQFLLQQGVRWHETSRHIPCQIMKVSGMRGDAVSELEVILSSNSLSDHQAPFPQRALNQLKDFSSVIPETELGPLKSGGGGRTDLSHLCVITIDPASARDLDDALSIDFLDTSGKKITYQELLKRQKALKDWKKNSSTVTSEPQPKPPGYRFQIGVHIADVTHYVRPGTTLDKEAASRTTTVYLVPRAIHMLPPQLSEQLCSLNPGEPKRTFSVLFTLDENLNVISTWFGKSTITCCCRMAYEHAQSAIEGGYAQLIKDYPEFLVTKPSEEEILQDKKLFQQMDDLFNQRLMIWEQRREKMNKDPLGYAISTPLDSLYSDDFEPWKASPKPKVHPIYNSFELKDVISSVSALDSVAKVLRARRYRTRGCVSLDHDVEINFILDPSNGLPLAAKSKERIDANMLVEEFMLLANQYVAERIFESFPMLSVLRNHPTPEMYDLYTASGQASKIGVPYEYSTSALLQKSISKSDTKYGYKRKFVKDTVINYTYQAMKLAQYFVSFKALPGPEDEGSELEAPATELSKMLAKTNLCDDDSIIPTATGANKQKKSNPLRHYALGLNYYTHFTSPIRRYPDILVHRLLQLALHGNQGNPIQDSTNVDDIGNLLPNDLVSTVDKLRFKYDLDPESLSTICDRCNEKKSQADKASDQCEELFLALFLDHVAKNAAKQRESNPSFEIVDPLTLDQSKNILKVNPVLFEAVVVDVGANLLKVLIPALGLTCKINTRTFKAYGQHWNPDEHCFSFYKPSFFSPLPVVDSNTEYVKRFQMPDNSNDQDNDFDCHVEGENAGQRLDPEYEDIVPDTKPTATTSQTNESESLVTPSVDTPDAVDSNADSKLPDQPHTKKKQLTFLNVKDSILSDDPQNPTVVVFRPLDILKVRFALKKDTVPMSINCLMVEWVRRQAHPNPTFLQHVVDTHNLKPVPAPKAKVNNVVRKMSQKAANFKPKIGEEDSNSFSQKSTFGSQQGHRGHRGHRGHHGQHDRHIKHQGFKRQNSPEHNRKHHRKIHNENDTHHGQYRHHSNNQYHIGQKSSFQHGQRSQGSYQKSGYNKGGYKNKRYQKSSGTGYNSKTKDSYDDSGQNQPLPSTSEENAPENSSDEQVWSHSNYSKSNHGYSSKKRGYGRKGDDYHNPRSGYSKNRKASGYNKKRYNNSSSSKSWRENPTNSDD